MSIQKRDQQSFSSFNHHFKSTFNPYIRHEEGKESQQISIYQDNRQYFEEFKKLYFTAYCIDIQFKRIEKTKKELFEKLNFLEENLNFESKQNSSEEVQSQRLKRFRRKADEIQRKFYCSGERCGRNYGSQGSLQQHIKLKHPQIFKQGQNFY